MIGAGLSLPGWGAHFAASHTGYPLIADPVAGLVWRDWFGAIASKSGSATLALQGDSTPVGARAPVGSAIEALTLAATATGYRPSMGSATAPLALDQVAAGATPAVLPGAGHAVFDFSLRLNAAAPVSESRRGIFIAFSGACPIELVGEVLEGFHRPLNGEAASLTVTVAHADLNAGWLQAPPLGTACAVSYDDDDVLSGALHGVDVTAAGVRLKVEG